MDSLVNNRKIYFLSHDITKYRLQKFKIILNKMLTYNILFVRILIELLKLYKAQVWILKNENARNIQWQKSFNK